MGFKERKKGNFLSAHDSVCLHDLRHWITIGYWQWISIGEPQDNQIHVPVGQSKQLHKGQRT